MANNTSGRTWATIQQQWGSTLSSMRPDDIITLLIYLTPMFSPIRICIEAGIFRRLAESSKPVSASDFASSVPDAQKFDSKQDVAEREEFIVRMLRAVCALNLVDEAGKHMYQANELTTTLAEPGFEAGFNFLFDTTHGPDSTNSHMLKWAMDNGYRAPETSTDGPYQQARGMAGTTSFEDWTRINPHHMSNLSLLMQRIQRGRLNWSEWFPADVLFGTSETGTSNDSVFMVDVGGGLGHDLSGFAKRYPDKKIRLVLQDQPEVINEARTQDTKLDSRIELSEHDFFKPQPVKGAQIVRLLSQQKMVFRLIDLRSLVFHAQDHARLAGTGLCKDPLPSSRCNGAEISPVLERRDFT